MRRINNILSECEEWENTPISEIFGESNVNINQKIKRIIVYGATQMGKTTMIMNLIGIRDEKKEELSKALRGKAKQGNSATSTPIVYNKWEKSSFGIALGDEISEDEGTLKEYSSKEAFVEAVSAINDQQRNLDQKEISSDGVRYYYLPKEYFKENKSNEDIQIIDLPGFGEKNARMHEAADAIIEHLIEFVAGSVAVIKAEKIVNLENEYKHFLNRIHTNHLAIALTCALSVDSDLKRQIHAKNGLFAQCKTANDYKEAILKYYHDRLTDEQNGYLSKERYPIEIIFPVEKRSEIKKEFPGIPELADAFDIILKDLLDRMESMRNTTSISACVEKLQEKEEVISLNLEEQKKLIARLEKEKCELIKEVDTNTEKVSQKCREIEELNEKVGELETSAKCISKKIDSLQKKEFQSARYCVEKKLIRWYINESSLFGALENFFVNDIQNLDMPLSSGFAKTIRETINQMDFSDISKKHFFKDDAIAEVNSFVRTVQRKLCGGKTYFHNYGEGKLRATLESNKNKVFKPLKMELEESNKKLIALEENQRIQEKRLAEKASELEFCNEKSASLEEEKKTVSKNKEGVVGIFVNHFSKKEKDLLERMEKETDPEATTALFLTYSAIYLNIKPYLEEQNNEQG